MLFDARVDQRKVLSRPVNRAAQPFANIDLRLEAQTLFRFLSAAEALAGMVPGTRRQKLDRHGIAGQLVDRGREFKDRSLNAICQIIDLTGRALGGAQHEPAHDVVYENEIARGDAPVLNRQRHALQTSIDKGRGDVAPNRRGGAAPAARTQNLSRTVYILKTRFDHRQLMLLKIIIRVKLADDF